jgi:hypothetical protein
MNKLVITAIALTITSFAAVDAANVTRPATSSIVYTQQEKVEVPVKDLPEAVKRTLATETYSGWEVSKAYLVTRENNVQYYQIDLTKGEETSSVNLDADGKKIE